MLWMDSPWTKWCTMWRPEPRCPILGPYIWKSRQDYVNHNLNMQLMNTKLDYKAQQKGKKLHIHPNLWFLSLSYFAFFNFLLLARQQSLLFINRGHIFRSHLSLYVSYLVIRSLTMHMEQLPTFSSSSHRSHNANLHTLHTHTSTSENPNVGTSQTHML